MIGEYELWTLSNEDLDFIFLNPIEEILKPSLSTINDSFSDISM